MSVLSEINVCPFKNTGEGGQMSVLSEIQGRANVRGGSNWPDTILESWLVKLVPEICPKRC